MKWETGIVSNSANWMVEGGLKSTIWTPVENKLFENALAKFDKDTPDRWQRVAEMVPGKTVADVRRQYKELEDDVSSIEAGFSPKYRYSNNSSRTCPFTLEWGDGYEFERCKSPPYGGGGTMSPVAVVAGRPVEHERKKGVPWTEEEHKLFLLGLKKYGKGDWRNISRNYVVTRTPTQVASHAQKYFIRQLSGGKDKRRASIHDITTVNVNESQNPPEQCKFQWNKPNDGGAGAGGVGATTTFNQANGNVFMGSQYRANIGFRTGGGDEFYGAPQNMSFQMQPTMHYPHG